VNQRHLYEYLKVHACVDCGEQDPLVLEFDHVRGRKKGNIAQMAHTHVWETVLQEIEKCDVRCANCHRRKSAHQLGWAKALLAAEDRARVA